MKTTIFLCRHGETDWNREKRFLGGHDVELNKEGERQSGLLGKELAKRDIAMIFSSPKKRALKTAEIVSEMTGVGVVVVEGLKERDHGVLDGKTVEWYKKHYPESYNVYEETKDMPGIKGVESVKELSERALSTLEEIARQNPDEGVAVITHGAFCKAFISELENIPLTSFRQHNCCINIIKHDGKAFKAEQINITKHLE
jgi:broad specificity phosphatase PhoE